MPKEHRCIQLKKFSHSEGEGCIQRGIEGEMEVKGISKGFQLDIFQAGEEADLMEFQKGHPHLTAAAKNTVLKRCME